MSASLLCAMIVAAWLTAAVRGHDWQVSAVKSPCARPHLKKECCMTSSEPFAPYPSRFGASFWRRPFSRL